MKTKNKIHFGSSLSLTLFGLVLLCSGLLINHQAHDGSSTVYADSCIDPTNYPPPGTGGMSYVNWFFDTSQSISSIQASINIYNDPGDTSDEYLQLYDANIDNTGQYFGLQTTGLAIFSEWGTSDESNVSSGSGSYVTNGTETGSQYVSLRHNFGDLPTGQYSVRMVRNNYDGTGDWFGYYVTFPNGSEQYIGAIRFPRANASTPASFHDGGGTWTEFWDNNNDSTLYPVPTWHVSVKITANSGLIPNSAVSSYSTMPDSDTYAESPGGYVDYLIGGSTPRCHPAGYLWQNINQSTATTTTPTSPSSSTPPPPSSTQSNSTQPTSTPTTSPTISATIQPDKSKSSKSSSQSQTLTNVKPISNTEKFTLYSLITVVGLSLLADIAWILIVIKRNRFIAKYRV